MNIIEFQKKLGGLLSTAQANGNKISTEQIEKSLRDLLLTPEQMEKVYEYLAAEKVTVAGRAKITAKESVIPSTKPEVEAVPLDEEEKQYLQSYRQTLEMLLPMSAEALERALAAAVSGNEEARQRVVEAYMPKVVEIALELHYGDVFLGDAISEGNLNLLTAVRGLKSTDDADIYITEAVRSGIRQLSEELLEQKRKDQSVVEKVRNLEEKIREITEDGELEFAVDELAIFMDMSRQEIEDILRLTGEGENGGNVS